MAGTDNRFESGRGQPQSKALAGALERPNTPRVLECGCPPPLFGVSRTSAIRRWGATHVIGSHRVSAVPSGLVPR